MSRSNQRGTGYQPVIALKNGLVARATKQFDLARLRAELKPFKLHWFPALGSTNTHAAKMRKEGRLLAPAVVLTGRQTAGRGRGGNVWHSPRGVITVSFVLRAHDTLPPQHVPLIAGLAVRNAIEELGIPGVGIKWPNDLWFDDRKVAGLLCERFGTIDVIGVGLNANLEVSQLPRTIAATTESLHAIAGRPVDVSSLVIALARALRSALDDPRTSLAGVLKQWHTHDVLFGRRIRIQRDGESDLTGQAAGIDSNGQLRVRTRSGVQNVLNGTVRPLKDEG